MTQDVADSVAHSMAPIADRRSAPRLRSLLTGTIVFDGKRSTMDCTVRNVSAYGAKVMLAEAYRIPDAFNLIVPHHDQMHRAKVIWRKDEVAGLALADVEDHERHKMTPREIAHARQKAMAAALF